MNELSLTARTSRFCGDVTVASPCSWPCRAVVLAPALAARRRLLLFEPQQEARLAGERLVGWVPKTEVADLVQALGQDMRQEAAQELMSGNAAGAPAVGFTLLVPDD